MSAAASRVITTSETGSGPAMRMSNRRVASCAPRRRSILAVDEQPRFYVVCESLPHVRGRLPTMSARRGCRRMSGAAHARRAACSSSGRRRSAISSMRSPSFPTSVAHDPDACRRLGGRARLRAADRAVPATCAASIPFGLRRWRRAPLAAATWRDIDAFRARCARTRYAAILDLQEQVKGALIARAGARRAPRLRPREHSRAARNARSTTSIIAFRATCTSSRAAGVSPVRRSAIATDAPPRWNLRVPAASARHARRAVRRRAARDEPRRQAVARGALARGDRRLRRGRIRDRAAVGQRRRGGAQPPARAGQRERRRPRVAVAAAMSRRCSRTRRSPSASIPASRISPRRSARRRSRSSP